MKTLPLALSLLLAFPILSVAEEGQRADWPQWRGPDRDGLIKHAKWPDRVDEKTLVESWRVKLGPSYSGPIVAGDQVFTTQTKDRKSEVVHAFDRKTGKQNWEASWEGAMRVPFFARANGDWIRSTPAYDESRLYVAGMRDVLVCIDTKTGETVWTVDFVKELETPLPSFGFVCSPLIQGDHVYVQAAGSLVKLEKETGEIVWRSLKDGGGMFGSAFSSPTIAKLADREQLLVQTRTKLAGVDLDEGDVLWSEEIPAFRGMNILTPLPYGDSVFTSSYGGKSFMFEVKADADKLSVADSWQNKVQGYMSSPVVIDGHAFLHLRNQRFCCINLDTGDTTWTTKPYGKYWSLVSNGEKILALDERGELLLIEADPAELKLIDRRKISDDPTWAHLAIAGDEVFIRELNHLVAYRWRAESE